MKDGSASVSQSTKRGLEWEHTYCMMVYCTILYKVAKTLREIFHYTQNIMEEDVYHNHVNMNQKEDGDLCWGCTHSIKITLLSTFIYRETRHSNQNAIYLENKVQVKRISIIVFPVSIKWKFTDWKITWIFKCVCALVDESLWQFMALSIFSSRQMYTSHQDIIGFKSSPVDKAFYF